MAEKMIDKIARISNSPNQIRNIGVAAHISC